MSVPITSNEIRFFFQHIDIKDGQGDGRGNSLAGWSDVVPFDVKISLDHLYSGPIPKRWVASTMGLW